MSISDPIRMQRDAQQTAQLYPSGYTYREYVSDDDVPRWQLLRDGHVVSEGEDVIVQLDGQAMTVSQAEMVEDDALIRWWLDDAEDMARATVVKMVEYGSGDLVALGSHLRRMADRPPLHPVESMELGCLMYLLGKIERAVEAVKADRPIKDDTWFDIEVYAKMARAARAGAWQIGEPT